MHTCLEKKSVIGKQLRVDGPRQRARAARTTEGDGEVS